MTPQFNARITIDNSSWSFEDYRHLSRDDRLLQQKLILNSCKAMPSPHQSAWYIRDLESVLLQWEEAVETKMEKLERLLKSHNWDFESETSHRFWRIGLTEKQHIDDLVSDLGPFGLLMYEAYRAKHLCRG